MCGTLLYGNVGVSGESNKVAGLPIDRDGLVLLHPDGSPQTGAQPPFLCAVGKLYSHLKQGEVPSCSRLVSGVFPLRRLRFSPQLFASEAPETVDG